MASDQEKFEKAVNNLPASVPRGPRTRDQVIGDAASRLAKPYKFTSNGLARGAKKLAPHVKRALKSRGIVGAIKKERAEKEALRKRR